MEAKLSVQDVLQKLAAISRKGPIPALGTGSKAVGATLLAELGVPQSSLGKAGLGGVVVNARRGTRASDLNRVNLFAKVPDWTASECKSSQEILERYGYKDGDGLKLYCSVSSRQPNSQGLLLEVNRARDILEEIFVGEGARQSIVVWPLPVLRERLRLSHPETLWVTAMPHERNGAEHFHYRFATHTRAPDPGMLGELLHAGTVTVDHLISNKGGRVTEKGPLFKIKPSNIHALFGAHDKYDLMDI